MEKSFNPSSFEKRIYSNWLDKKYFNAKVNKTKSPFTIVMPPPNITDKLHIGHAYNTTIQDAIVRFKRMQGYEALLLPGTDHAALATEVKVVERLKKQGITKEELGREKFLEKMYEWYDEFGGLILEQFKSLGLSCDWDRLSFTLDESRSKAVRQAFVNLYNKGLIYEGKRITNWCVKCKTALSDIEVEYEEHNGNIWYINYKVENSNDVITVATTRPETILGDTAVAVNPKDKRYKNLIGKNVLVPFINKPIPVITDNYVDPKFGTGMVKITPAHDPNDFEVGLRHNLEVIKITNDDGTMNELAGKYCGLDRYECRKQIVEDLKNLGQLVKIEAHKNNVGHCQRCHEVIEPVISRQWYVKMKGLAKEAIKVVKENKIKFIPKRNEKIYFNWMENINDWCISRQIWSGHRIPIFNCSNCGNKIVELTDPTVCPKCGSKHLTQEEDSLDTWFSSALWPFSTLGWPQKTEDYNYFYPTSALVTAYDIIFFWVARMIFSAVEYTNEVPFKEVLIHGLIRDSQGRKMSKSLGNGIDPIDVINKYGADTLRYSLLNGSSIGMDSRIGYEKFDASANFFNKIWNASRFVIENVEKNNFKQIDIAKTDKNIFDTYILTELNKTIKSVGNAFDKYDLGLACSLIYEFAWNKYCDWYIEACKPRLYSTNEQVKNNCLNILVYVLEKIIKMLHPIAPFVTEELYLNLPLHGESIMIESFPKVNKKLENNSDYETCLQLMDAIKKVRNIRAELNVADNVKTNLIVMPLTNQAKFESVGEEIKKLAFGKEIKFVKNESAEIENCNVCLNAMLKIFVPTGDLVNKEKELIRLNGELEKAEAELKRANGMLNNAGFVARAPKNLIDAEKEKITKYTELKNSILDAISKLK